MVIVLISRWMTRNECILAIEDIPKTLIGCRILKFVNDIYFLGANRNRVETKNIYNRGRKYFWKE